MYERFESRWMPVKLTCYDKTITVFFINFTTFFVGGILWWTDLVIKIYSNLYNTTTFETEIEHFFTHWKHLQSRVNVFWYCFWVIKRYMYLLLFDDIGSYSRKTELF